MFRHLEDARHVEDVTTLKLCHQVINVAHEGEDPGIYLRAQAHQSTSRLEMRCDSGCGPVGNSISTTILANNNVEDSVAEP